MVRQLVLRCLAALCVLFPGIANAQTTTYTNSSDGAVNENATPCTASGYLVRNFTVGTSYTVSDVDIGILAAHTYRGDFLMYLTSPAGTRVQLFTGTGAGAQNFNVLLDGGAGTSVTTHSGNDSATASTSVPPYEETFAPANSLAAFNGQNSLGTWRFEICDRFNQDSGTFYQADLFLTQAPSNFADLSLTKSVSSTTPSSGANITYTLALNNSGSSNQTANSVIVTDVLPPGVTFVSASGFGTYDDATGLWTISSIAPGQTHSLSIVATVAASAGASVTNIAEVTSSNRADLDSTPNNGASAEDDYAAATFTVSGTRTAGTPPSLTAVCPIANQILFDWQGRAWSAGDVNEDEVQTGIGTINYALSSDTAFVGGSPTINTTNTGGLGSGEQGLFINLNNNSQSDEATTVVTLPTAVPGLQFRIFDIDFGNNSFADKITVTGSFNGSQVLPTLTNGVANYVAGNIAIGDASSGGASANGNVVVTFLSPVDTIVISYGNHTTAPTNPGNQFMTIHDITLCQPDTTLSVTKISQVLSDPINNTTDPKAIPGAIVQYCILISNAGSATAATLSATDNIPTGVTYNAASMRSGSNCGSAATVEDDDAAGADEGDPFGASISGATLTATAASLAPAEAYALTFQVTVD